MRGVVLTTALMAFTIGVAAQPLIERPPPIHPRALPEVLKSLQPDAPPEARSVAGGAGQSLASSGREDLTHQSPAFTVRSVCKPLLRDGKPVEPVGYITEAARNARITMINESHAEPLTRYFIGKVAAALRKEGYAAYGAETFAPQIAYEASTPPLAREGFYSREPVFGRLVRQLRKDGWRLFPYEFIPLPDPKGYSRETATLREVGQAANLTQQISREEKAKILVHVGHGHLQEYSAPDGIKQMGQVFAEANNINPLTIETTRFESPDASFVVCDPAAFEGKPSAVDIRIGVPKVTYDRGRVSWRVQEGDRFAEIPASLRRSSEVAIYEARPIGERSDSTPMDRLLLRPGEDLPLLLPPGRYDLAVWTEKDGWSANLPLTVR
jgi:hypothetical protein